MREGIKEFKSLGWFPLQHRGICFTVELDDDYWDLSQLSSNPVKIDGNVVRLKGIERFCHTPPWRKGELVSLLVDIRE